MSSFYFTDEYLNEHINKNRNKNKPVSVPMNTYRLTRNRMKALMKLQQLDEDEFSQTRIKSIVQRFMPDNYMIDFSKSRSRRDTDSQRYRCDRHICGYCFPIKLFVVFTLFVAFVITLTDRCFKSGIHCNETDIDSQLEFDATTLTENDCIVSEYCIFKAIYATILVAGEGVYFVISLFYFGRLVYIYYEYRWNLLESLMLLSYSSVLLIFTFVSFFTMKHVISALAMIDAILGLIMSYVMYSHYRLGIIAVMYLPNDPDEIITKVLTRRTFVKREPSIR